MTFYSTFTRFMTKSNEGVSRYQWPTVDPLTFAHRFALPPFFLLVRALRIYPGSSWL